ncbi:hypothetical protein JWG39_02185 [Desulforhopalus vacuolatus]|uniref:hypothetical protein n=1 Tax=Desulforhopalus vacuolatus TaxID=40414 RepID=UPI001963CB2E|nr:hypothetical protein [Desulforhopalus vacuolatus]MBM9518625.1 hypothetical protein [Desulforhopalus vacuolatus]
MRRTHTPDYQLCMGMREGKMMQEEKLLLHNFLMYHSPAAPAQLYLQIDEERRGVVLIPVSCL